MLMKNMNIHTNSKSKLTSDEKKKILVKKMISSTKAWIQSYKEFLSKSWNNIQTQKLRERLAKFKDWLEKANPKLESIDPIIYLKKLYYLREMTLEDIYEKINDLGLNYADYWSLYYLFTDVFDWELRERWDYTDAQRLRSAELPQVDKLKACNDKLRDWNIDRFNEAIKKILESKNRKKPDFSLEEYNNFSGKKSERHNKMFYLLECFSGITFENIIEVAETTWLGARTLSRVINMKVSVIKIEQNISEDLEIKASNISYYLAERKKKKNAN